ncbi:MAG: hypothetical protein MJ208_04385 [Bacilli bacterium]|nr:hypothetical protein [Bacilli bacterium]
MIEHFSRYNKPDKKILTEYLLPIAIQLGIFLILMLLHRFTVKAGFNIQEPESVNGMVSSPTVGRLVYLLINPFLIATAIYFALYFNKKKDDLLTFVFANASGILLWQFFGEDFWHFSINGIHFLTFETAEALPIMFILILLLVYFALKKEKNWGLWLILIVFSYNWMGRFITEGLYPFVSSVIPFYMWSLIIALTVCLLACLFSLYLGLYASKDKQARYLSSILTFASVSILIMNIIHSS